LPYTTRFRSIFGPALYAGFVTWFKGARYGVLSVLPFLAAGLVVILFVREPRKPKLAEEPAVPVPAS
jgi:MFS-type transporter involved in bile tolerance (Atg22 family)